MRVGFAGLGLMGSRIARRLSLSGAELLLWDRTASRAREVASGIPGSVAAADLGELGAADVVFVMVRDSPATLSVVSGLPAGRRTVVNLGTILPQDSLRIRSIVESGGGRFVDAPVVGSTPAAEEGRLVVLASGERRDVEGVMPLLSLIGRTIYAGPIPSGTHAKLAANLILAGMTEVLAEALEFSDSVGLDRRVLADVLGASPYHNAYFDLKLGPMMRGEFPAQFPLELMHKDLRYILAVAQEAGAFVPLTALAEQLYGEAERRGCSREDVAAISRFIGSGCGPPGASDVNKSPDRGA